MLGHLLAIKSDCGDIGCYVHAYIPINGADLAPKKVCFEEAQPRTLEKTNPREAEA